MMPPEFARSARRQIEDGLGRVAWYCFRNPLQVVLLVFVVTALSTWSERSLEVDADLSRLLPDSIQSVQNLERLRKRFGGVGYIAVLAKGARPDALRRFADELAERIERLPEIAYVDCRKPDRFFADRALYFVEIEDLKRIRDRLKKRHRWEVLKRNPLFLDLEDTEKPALEFHDIERKYRGRRQGNPFHKGTTEETHYLDGESGTVLVLARPSNLAADLGFSRRAVAAVQSVVDEMKGAWQGSGISTALAGRYKKKLDQQHLIESDLGRASLLSLLFMVGYIAVHFRSVGAVFLLAIPLAVGLTWTYGFVGRLLSPLNILTAFAGVILLGIGIDSGIHLLQRYDSEIRLGVDPERAVYHSFGETGRVALLAALTTVAAFLAISISEFRGFREFGWLAAAGTGMVVLSYLTLLPALIGVRRRLRRKPSGGINAAAERNRDASGSLLPRRLDRHAPAIFWLALLGAFGVAVYIPQIEFEYDFAALDARDLESYRLDDEVNRILGRSQTPLVVEVEGIDQARQAVRSIRQRKNRLGKHSGVDFVATTADLVPQKQREKEKVVAEIRHYLSRVDRTELDDDTAEHFGLLERMASAKPFGRDELPRSVVRQFTGLAHREQKELVLAFPSISLSDGRRIRELARELSRIPLGDGTTVSASGETMVLSDILDEIFSVSPWMLIMTALLVCAVLWSLLGRLALAVSCILPAALTLACTTGVLVLCDLRFNYLNIVVMPVLLGIGVDGATHLVTRFADGEGLQRVLAQTGRAILGSSVTTGLGFGALLASHQPGLRSLAIVAIIGIVVNLVATLVIVPAGMAVLTRAANEIRTRGGNAVATMVATVGGAGYAPHASGSLGALLALPVGWSLSESGIALRALVCIATTVIGTVSVQHYLSQKTARRDPSEVVIDEFAGCLIAICFVPWQPLWVTAAYLLFRTFDIWKPGPIGYLDGKLKNSLAVMGDDVAAGLVAGVLLAGVRAASGIIA